MVNLHSKTARLFENPNLNWYHCPIPSSEFISDQIRMTMLESRFESDSPIRFMRPNGLSLVWSNSRPVQLGKYNIKSFYDAKINPIYFHFVLVASSVKFFLKKKMDVITYLSTWPDTAVEIGQQSPSFTSQIGIATSKNLQ